MLPDGSPVVRIADIIRGRATATPDRVALIEPGGATTTYADLDFNSSRVAQALLGAGVEAGDRVTYIGANGPQFLEVVYGPRRSGPSRPRSTTGSQHPRCRPSSPTPSPPSSCSDRPRRNCGASWWRRRRCGISSRWSRPPARWVTGTGSRATSRATRADPDATAILMYTSGTTGRPKGIELSGNNFGHAVAVLCYDVGLGVESVQMAAVPFFHIAGLGVALVGGIAGGALLLDSSSDPDHLRRMFLEHRVPWFLR